MSRGRADEPTISRGAPDLPQSLANRVYAILLDERHEQRSAELREICKLHPEHSKTVATIARRMLGGELLLAGLERAAGDASPDQGTFVGPFRLVDQLGEGGFGVVWLAEQEEPLRRQVALKLLLPGLESRRLLASFAAS